MFKGLGIAVITPFKTNLEPDFESLKRIIEHLVSHGADYLVMMGTTAESPTLSKDEKRKLFDIALEVNNSRIPVMAGIGGNHTLQVAKDIESFNFKGIDGILSVSPYYNKPSQQGIYRHYQIIANSTDLPIILYNVPGRTASNITAETTLKLAHDIKNIAGMKEASGNFDQIMQIVKNKPDNFLVISGDDLLTLPFISSGLDGVISVIGNAFPKEFSTMIKVFDSNPSESRAIHYKLQEFMRLIFEEGSPSGIKGLLNLMGLCELTVRPPLFELSDHVYQKLKIELQKFN